MSSTSPVTGQKIKFKHGTYSSYVTLKNQNSIDVNAFYYCTDTNQFFLGNIEYTRPVKTGEGAPTSQTASTEPMGSLYYDSTNQVLYSNLSGSWTSIANNINISVMTGATASAPGSSGLVPAPTNKHLYCFLQGDGSWGNPLKALPVPQTVNLNDCKGYDNNNVTYYCTLSTYGYSNSAQNIPDSQTPPFQFLLRVDKLPGKAHKLCQTCIKGDGKVYRRIIDYNNSTNTYTYGEWEQILVDTTYSAATQSTDGLMSSTDKTKLDSITPANLLTNSDIIICTQSEYDNMQTRTGLLYFIKEDTT